MVAATQSDGSIFSARWLGDMGFPQIWGAFVGVPMISMIRFLGCVLVSPHLEEVPYGESSAVKRHSARMFLGPIRPQEPSCEFCMWKHGPMACLERAEVGLLPAHGVTRECSGCRLDIERPIRILILILMGVLVIVFIVVERFAKLATLSWKALV